MEQKPSQASKRKNKVVEPTYREVRLPGEPFVPMRAERVRAVVRRLEDSYPKK